MTLHNDAHRHMLADGEEPSRARTRGERVSLQSAVWAVKMSLPKTT